MFCLQAAYELLSVIIAASGLALIAVVDLTAGQLFAALAGAAAVLAFQLVSAGVAVSFHCSILTVPAFNSSGVATIFASAMACDGVWALT